MNDLFDGDLTLNGLKQESDLLDDSFDILKLTSNDPSLAQAAQIPKPVEFTLADHVVTQEQTVHIQQQLSPQTLTAQLSPQVKSEPNSPLQCGQTVVPQPAVPAAAASPPQQAQAATISHLQQALAAPLTQPTQPQKAQPTQSLLAQHLAQTNPLTTQQLLQQAHNLNLLTLPSATQTIVASEATVQPQLVQQQQQKTITAQTLTASVEPTVQATTQQVSLQAATQQVQAATVQATSPQIQAAKTQKIILTQPIQAPQTSPPAQIIINAQPQQPAVATVGQVNLQQLQQVGQNDKMAILKLII